MLHLGILQSVPWAGLKWLEQVAEYALIFMAVLIALTISIKYFRFTRSRKKAELYAFQVAQAFKQLNWRAAFRISEDYSKNTYLARVVLSGLKQYRELKSKLPADKLAKHMDEAMKREIMAIHFEHTANLGLLDAIGATSPFIGALGGSSITLAFGIVLAVPTIWLATYLRNKAQLLEVDMKTAASELIIMFDISPDETDVKVHGA